MVDKNKSQMCGCSFLVDEHGQPVVECPDSESQAIAFAALQKNPDVSIRVAAAVVPFEDADIAGSDMDDFDADDLELDDNDEDVEEDGDDLPF